MRKIARTTKPGEIAQCILYAGNNGVYVFPCSSLEDGFAMGDHWFASIEEAEAACQEAYGIERLDWKTIDDPLPGCLQDWIAPVRVKGSDKGMPVWGTLERLENGVWKEIQKRGS